MQSIQKPCKWDVYVCKVNSSTVGAVKSQLGPSSSATCPYSLQAKNGFYNPKWWEKSGKGTFCDQGNGMKAMFQI